jgi:hypothetical protein
LLSGNIESRLWRFHFKPPALLGVIAYGGLFGDITIVEPGEHRPHQRRPQKVDEAANGHSGSMVEQWQHRLEHFATHVLEIDVDAGRAGGGEVRRQGR